MAANIALSVNGRASPTGQTRWDFPKVGYVTFLDAVFLASFIFCFLAIFEITLVYLLQKHDRRSLAVKLHSAGKWAYPLAYFGSVAALAIRFLA